MWRIAAIAVAGALGAVSLMLSEAGLVGMGAAETAAETEEARMRVCLGPARILVGGAKPVGLAFGGEGCDERNANLVGFRILKVPVDAAPAAPTLTFRM